MIIFELAEYLCGLGYGTFDPDNLLDSSNTIFLETMPDTPDECIGLFTSAGQPPDAKTTVYRPAVQILVRVNRGPKDAMAKAVQIHTALHGLSSTTFVAGGTRIMLCTARQSEPVRLGPDENGRYVYSINLALITGGE